MGTSVKKQSAQWGKRSGMKKGDAQAPGHPGGGPSRGKVHDSGFSYADYSKTNPGTGKK